MEKKPELVLMRAVSGMLPSNKLRVVRMRRLKVFPDEWTPYGSNTVRDYEAESYVKLLKA